MAPTPQRKGWNPDLTPKDARRAAALLLIYPGPAGLSFALTVRHADLPNHGGQVSLPGGAIDAGESARDAALREAREELGIDTTAVRVVGSLSSFWLAVSGFVVQPFVGVTDARPAFRPAAGEVTEVLDVSIADWMDPSKRGWEQRARDGVVVRYPYVSVSGHQVWGATAMMLSEFEAILEG